jgi:hypothetical protein
VAIGAAIPVFIVAAVVWYAAGKNLFGANALAALGPVAELLLASLSVVLTALGAGAASWVYLWALDHPRPAAGS